MKRLIIMLVVTVLATLTLAAAASASTSSVPTRHVVVGEPCVKGGQIATCWMTRRKHFQLTIGPSEWIARARWSHWNGHSARGRGTLWVSDVGTQRLGRVTVVLSRPRGHQLISGHRHPHFTRMHLTGPGARDTARRWRWEGRFHEWQEAATAASLRSVPVVDASGHGWAHPSVRHLLRRGRRTCARLCWPAARSPALASLGPSRARYRQAVDRQLHPELRPGPP